MFNHHNEKFMKNKFIKTTIIDVLFYFIIYIYLTFLSPYLNLLGWSEFAKGWFFSIFAITGIIVAPIIGTISDKVGRFKIILIGFGLEILAIIGYILITNPVALMFLRILSAIAFNTVVITAFSRVNDTFTNKERSKKTGIFHSLLSVATMIAPLLGGVVADAYGYKAVFATSLMISIIAFVGILIHDKLYYKDTSPHRKKETLKVRDGNPLLDILDMLKIKEMRAMSFLGVMTNFTTPFTIMVLPFIIINKMGLSNTHLSIALFIIGSAHICQFLFGSFADWFGKGKSVVLGLTITSVALVAMFFTKSYNTLLIILLIKAAGGGLWNVSAWSYMSDIGEKLNIEGKIVGSYSALARVSTAISFIIAGSILSLWQEGIFLFFAAVIIIPLIIVGKKIIKNDPSKVTN